MSKSEIIRLLINYGYHGYNGCTENNHIEIIPMSLSSSLSIINDNFFVPLNFSTYVTYLNFLKNLLDDNQIDRIQNITGGILLGLLEHRSYEVFATNIIRFLIDSECINISDLKRIFTSKNFNLMYMMKCFYDYYIDNCAEPEFFIGYMNCIIGNNLTKLFDKYVENVVNGIHKPYFDADIEPTYFSGFPLNKHFLQPLINLKNYGIINLNKSDKLLASAFMEYMFTLDDSLCHHILELYKPNTIITYYICNTCDSYEKFINFCVEYNLKVHISLYYLSNILIPPEKMHWLNELFIHKNVIIKNDLITFYLSIHNLNMYKYLIENNLLNERIPFHYLHTNIGTREIMRNIACKDIELFEFIIRHTDLPDDVISGDTELMTYFCN